MAYIVMAYMFVACIIMAGMDELRLTSTSADSGSFGAWPIVGLSYLMLRPLDDCSSMCALHEFGMWLLSDGVAREGLHPLSFALMLLDIIGKVDHRLSLLRCDGESVSYGVYSYGVYSYGIFSCNGESVLSASRANVLQAITTWAITT